MLLRFLGVLNALFLIFNVVVIVWGEASLLNWLGAPFNLFAVVMIFQAVRLEYRTNSYRRYRVK